MPITDYIGIRGLDGQEPFQGVGGESTSDEEGSIGLEWGEMPEETVTLMSQYTDDINAWLDEIKTYEASDDGTRGLPAELPAVPAIPAIMAALASTGGAALPAVATVMISQALVNTVGSALQNFAAKYDKNSLEYIMRKSLLYKDNDGNECSVLDDRLSDLAYVDQIIDFGPFRVHIKGKMIEYGE
jgi:hypothetical protein